MASWCTAGKAGLNAGLVAGLVAIFCEAPNRSDGDVTGSPFTTPNRQRVADTMKA